jgi:macrolide-specific efflux system membrane fusion protein
MISSLILVIPLISACSIFPQEELDAIPTLVEPPESRTVTYVAEKGYIAEEIRCTTRVAPFREQTLYFTTSGRLNVLNVKYGDKVKKGDILAQLDIKSLEQSLTIAEIDLKQSEMRLERLRAEAAIDESRRFDLEMMELDHLKQVIRIESQRAQVAAATIVAPFDGVITSLNAQIGQNISEFAAILVISDPSDVELQTQFTLENDFRRLAPGQTARIELTRGNWVPAVVTYVPSQSLRQATGPEKDQKVRLQLLDPVPLELNQLFSTVIVVNENPEAIIIPTSAIREYMGRVYVRVVEGDTRREVDITTGIRSGNYTEIISGLEVGTVVMGR